MLLNLKEIKQSKIKLTQAKKVWMVELLFLLLKNIRSFRQKQNIEGQIEVYCELTQKLKNKFDINFDFNFFLLPLTKSKVIFDFPRLEKDANENRFLLNDKNCLFYIVDLKPFGTLKFPQLASMKKNCLKSELQKKFEYFDKEFVRAQSLLANKNFVRKAPVDLVKSEKKKLVYFAEQKKKILEQLENNKWILEKI